jgi:2,3-bisphosphoglycerate-independent phosphoglycerate mutase
MDIHQLTRDLHTKSKSKIVMLVADGLGGLPMTPGGPTELEAARRPTWTDWLRAGFRAQASLSRPGLLRAVVQGIWVCLATTRCNTSSEGVRWKRLVSVLNWPTAMWLSAATSARWTRTATSVTDVLAGFRPRKVLRWPCGCGRSRFRASRSLWNRSRSIGLWWCCVARAWVATCGTPIRKPLGVPPLDPVADDPGSQKTAEVAKEFLVQARRLLAEEPKANFHTMRGFASKPALPSYGEVYGLRAAAIAVYPMYKGLARLVGMDIVGQAQSLDDQIQILQQHWDQYDFFFLHFKYTDSTGEDGNFDAKVKRIEELDASLPRITALNPDVLIVTGDHSTPAYLKSHSWHPVPTLLVSDCCRPDGLKQFNESTCIRGGLGHFEAKYLMCLALANAGRLGKYGA